MTYSLNTLNADRATQTPAGVGRFAQEIGLVLGAAALAFWLLALLSHSLADPAWSTTGSQPEVGNWAGRLGALLADGSYYLLGFSVWWCFFAGVQAWLSVLAGWLRGQQGGPKSESSPPTSRWQGVWLQPASFWVGLLLVLLASAVLEWSRLYRFDALLPGHAGGVLGEWWGRWPSAGWASPVRRWPCWRCWWLVCRACSVFPGVTGPSAWASRWTTGSSRGARSARRWKTSASV